MGISIWQLLIILAIVLLLFGTKRLRNLGSDLGGAIKGFKKSVGNDDATEESSATVQQRSQEVESIADGVEHESIIDVEPEPAEPVVQKKATTAAKKAVTTTATKKPAVKKPAAKKAPVKKTTKPKPK